MVPSTIRCPTLIYIVGGMPLPKTGATHYHAKLELSDKGHAIRDGCLLGVTLPNTSGVWIEKDRFGSP